MSEHTTRRWSHWTDAERELLARLWTYAKTEEIKKALPRHSMRSIYHTVYALKLKRPANVCGRRVHDPNWKFWNEWSPNLAYVVGLLAADGCIAHTSHQHGIRLTLKQSDLYLLERIRDLAGGTVFTQGCVAASTWRLAGIDVSSRLAELGITPCKTARIVVPSIPQEYLSHFVRGYFDGDGTVGEYKVQRGTTKRVSIAGNLAFMSGVRSVIAEALVPFREHVLSRPIPKLKTANVWILTLSRRPVVEALLLWMYSGADLYLSRKKTIAETLIGGGSLCLMNQNS